MSRTPGSSAPPPGSRDLRTLPKAHLHLHFTGSMRLQTLRDCADAQGVRLPTALREGTDLQLDDADRGWFRFQRNYDSARAVVRSERIMRRIVDEAVADDAAEGSRRLEIQVDPTAYAPFVGGITPAIEIVLDEARLAAHRHGISVGVIVAASRMRHPLDARILARLAAQHAGSDSVIGFGLSNDERRGDTSEFAHAFQIARRADLLSVPHAGELLGTDHIHQVLVALRPDRLGHGVRLAEDPRLLERVVADGIALEVCPASNVALGVYASAEQVPLRQLFDAGARIALGADDPLIFGSRLLAQYETARSVGFLDAELAELARRSLLASRLDSEALATALGDVEAWLAAPGDSA
ncbi:adenosine deaminase [Micrococcales bacterium 31B]|nr:adenosine deaminase [Micrococcales bacterium 31B]